MLVSFGSVQLFLKSSAQTEIYNNNNNNLDSIIDIGPILNSGLSILIIRLHAFLVKRDQYWPHFEQWLIHPYHIASCILAKRDQYWPHFDQWLIHPYHTASCIFS